MGVMSKLEGKQEKEIIFPCLMRHVRNGSVVLFSSDKVGVVVQKGDKGSCDVGHHCDYWVSAANENTWEPFKGTVTLSNE